MINDTDLKFQHPFCMMVAGPSQCGKTRFIMDLLKHRLELIEPAPTRVVYCYSVWQSNYDDMKHMIPSIEFQQGVPALDGIDPDDNNIIILDDLMSECIDDKNILHLFTVGSHHNNISPIFLTQNIFCKGKHARSISLNSHYLILFRNPRDPSQVWHLGRQIYPRNMKYFEEAFNDAVSQPYGYLVVDLKQETRDELRLRTLDRKDNRLFTYIKK